jgi:hypothetical protein
VFLARFSNNVYYYFRWRVVRTQAKDEASLKGNASGSSQSSPGGDWCQGQDDWGQGQDDWVQGQDDWCQDQDDWGQGEGDMVKDQGDQSQGLWCESQDSWGDDTATETEITGKLQEMSVSDFSASSIAPPVAKEDPVPSKNKDDDTNAVVEERDLSDRASNVSDRVPNISGTVSDVGDTVPNVSDGKEEEADTGEVEGEGITVDSEDVERMMGLLATQKQSAEKQETATSGVNICLLILFFLHVKKKRKVRLVSSLDV